MSFISSAQVIMEDETPNHAHLDDNVVMYEDRPSEEAVLEIHDEPVHEVTDAPMSFLKLPNIPGAPSHAQDDLVVEDQAVEIDEAPEAGPADSWDWSHHGPENFMHWIAERFNGIPQHSGQDTAGLERAIAFLEKLDGEISKAMRSDFDAKIDSDTIEKARDQIDDGIYRLKERLEQVSDSKHKSKKKKKRAEVTDSPLVKEGQKATHVGGIIVTVPLLISRVARVCINGMVSAGHDIEDLFAHQVKQYSLTEREQAETMQLLADMGYPLRRDRGISLNDDMDPRSSSNLDWSSNYPG